MSYNPSLDGLAAYFNGEPRDKCPSTYDEQGRDAWLQGWDLAQSQYGPETPPPAPAEREPVTEFA